MHFPICALCKHYDDKPGERPSCRAFPGGIPERFIHSRRLHENVAPGQNGEFVLEVERCCERVLRDFEPWGPDEDVGEDEYERLYNERYLGAVL